MISPPYKWQVRYNASDIEVKNRIDSAVNHRVVKELYDKFEDFRRAYDEGGLSVEEFDSYPPTVRTLRQFLAGGQQLGALIRDFMLPNPDD